MLNQKLKISIIHKNGFEDTFTICEYVLLDRNTLAVYTYYKSYLARITLKRETYSFIYLLKNNTKTRIF